MIRNKNLDPNHNVYRKYFDGLRAIASIAVILNQIIMIFKKKFLYRNSKKFIIFKI